MAVALVIAAVVGMLGWFSVRNYHLGLEKIASTDPLTGCATRRVFDVMFEQVVKNSLRNKVPVSLLAIDVDRFKQVNDTRGHAAGDQILRRLSDIFRSHLRNNDTVCRWGGDEFLILLSDCALDDARRIADAIRADVVHHDLPAGEDLINITVSIGAAQHRSGEDQRALVARADEAMYRAKRRGRDQVAESSAATDLGML